MSNTRFPKADKDRERAAARAAARASPAEGGRSRPWQKQPGGLSEAVDWSPPPPSVLQREAAQRDLALLPPVTVAQQSAVRQWLQELGLTLRDGEGGFLVPSAGPLSAQALGSPRPPLSLQQDRLRNGELLCDLLLRIEPRAALHAQLHRLLHRGDLTSPNSVLPG